MQRTFLFLAFLSLAMWSTVAAGQTALTGSMGGLQYLVGTWDCSVDAMNAGTMMHTTGTLTFAEAPGNALSQTISSPMYAGAGFIGTTQGGHYFYTNADNMGGTSSETTSMETSGPVVFLGSGTQQGHTFPQRDTEVRISDTQVHSTTEGQIGGKWVKFADAMCTKR